MSKWCYFVIGLMVLGVIVAATAGDYANEQAKEEADKELLRFGYTRGSYAMIVMLSHSYNLPQDAYLAWEYSICEGFGENYLVMLGASVGDSTWMKQYLDGTICEECRFWYQANRDTMPVNIETGGI